jgi:hypothetical protein
MNKTQLKQLIKEIITQEIVVNKPNILFKDKLKAIGVNYNSIEIDGVNPSDYPDYADVYISYAEWKDGAPLTKDELDKLNELDEFNNYAHELAHDT